MKTWIQKALGMVTAMGVGALMLGTLAAPAKADDAPLATYGVDVVSGYVIRGDDQYVRVYNKAGEEKEHPMLLVTPALQPYITLFGSSGFSLNLWGSFALTDRADDLKTSFVGLGRDDELDYTFNFDWANKMGGFTASLITYTYFHSCYGDTRCTKTSSTAGFAPDARLTWVMPFAKSVNPYFAFTASQKPGAWYASLGISGGESLVWSVVADEVGGGLKAVTGKIGYPIGSMTVALWAAYRPNPTLLSGGYDADGKYVVDGEEKTYPSTIAWLSFTYSGSVAAK